MRLLKWGLLVVLVYAGMTFGPPARAWYLIRGEAVTYAGRGLRFGTKPPVQLLLKEIYDKTGLMVAPGAVGYVRKNESTAEAEVIVRIPIKPPGFEKTYIWKTTVRARASE